jgi:uncharacterized membrane protein YfcA
MEYFSTHLQTMLLVFTLALVFEIIDASLGQGYGTLGSPVFILLGFDSKVVVPAILISQAIGGLAGAFFHHKLKNADFGHWQSEDIKKVYVIVSCGIVGVVAASFLGIKISKHVLSLYIGSMVLIIGILALSGLTWQFSWRKLILIGAISAFNKGLSGGGYGPLVAGGQTIIGVNSKAAVAITDFAEAPICLAGFLTWLLFGGELNMVLVLPMCLGAGIAPMIGAWITYKIPTHKFRSLLGSVLLVLGLLCLAKVINP